MAMVATHTTMHRLLQELEQQQTDDGEVVWMSLSQTYKQFMLSKRDVAQLERKVCNPHEGYWLFWFGGLFTREIKFPVVTRDVCPM